MESAKLLLVEDNDDLRFLYTKTLQESGFTVEAVSNGSEALDVIKIDKFDLLLLDVVMPVIDGIGLLERLYKEYSRIPMKTILLTNFAYQDIVKQAGKYGVFDIIQKSDIVPAQLVEKVRELLSS